MANLEERFWAKVDKRGPDECWEWTGARDGRYGQICHDGRNRKAHQISFMLAFDDTIHDIPAGQMVCHTCDNPGCVNPAHLWLGTMSENIKDAVAKGRHVPGTGTRNPTHCKRGHLLPTERDRQGRRKCMECRKIHDQRHEARAALTGIRVEESALSAESATYNERWKSKP
jgi:hypothetical protein